MREPERRQGTFRRNDRRLRNGRSKKRVGLESQFHAPDIVGRRNRCFCNHFLRTHLRNRLSEDPFARCRKTKCGKKHDKQQNDPFHSTLFHSVAANIKKGTGRAKRKPKFSWEVMPNRILTHQSRNGFGGISNNITGLLGDVSSCPEKKSRKRNVPSRDASAPETGTKNRLQDTLRSALIPPTSPPRPMQLRPSPPPSEPFAFTAGFPYLCNH